MTTPKLSNLELLAAGLAAGVVLYIVMNPNKAGRAAGSAVAGVVVGAVQGVGDAIGITRDGQSVAGAVQANNDAVLNAGKDLPFSPFWWWSQMQKAKTYF